MIIDGGTDSSSTPAFAAASRFLQRLDAQHRELVLAARSSRSLTVRRRHHATSTKTRSPSTFTGKVRRFTQTGARIASPVR